MAKQLKLHIKNSQLAEAINLSGLKARLSRKKEQSPEEEDKLVSESVETTPVIQETLEVAEPVVSPVEEASPVVFSEPEVAPVISEEVEEIIVEELPQPVEEPKREEPELPPKPVVPRPFVSASRNNPEQLGPVFGRELPSPARPPMRRKLPEPRKEPVASVRPAYQPFKEQRPAVPPKPPRPAEPLPRREAAPAQQTPRLPKKEPKQEMVAAAPAKHFETDEGLKKPRAKTGVEVKGKATEGKGFIKRSEGHGVDSRLKRGITSDEEDESGYRKRRPSKGFKFREQQQEVTRPTKISVRIPISVKDLAAEMKLKASQLIASLFLQGTIVTLNDLLTDETMIQLLGHELGCEVAIDTSEEQRLRITDKTISEEILQEPADQLTLRPPVVTFMGHVDHGKTSLIDAIRSSNRASGEVGAITQHIGAFTCTTTHGPVTIIDTPGHEAFSAMRERGAGLTDIVVLVVAGDEGMKEQTIEALQQAKESKATIIVAINKSDKQNFDQDRVFRQLADQELLPEAWGGSTVTVPCSALTHAGIPELLEMIALQSEVLELRANPLSRARGTVIESEMCKGIGAVATILVQNGTLRAGDCLVFGSTWARVKTMRNDVGKELEFAGPSTPVRINGLSGLPSAGEEFIVVKNEKEARDIAESRREGLRQLSFQTKRRVTLESMIEKASGGIVKKTLNVVLRADVQGSLEALKTALLKIESNKVELNIISLGVGEVSESDVQLAATSNAIILGFHTGIEAHAEPMVKELGVTVRLHDIIYHAQDDIKERMRKTLDRIAEEQEKGRAEVRAIFKSSQLGLIAGCIVTDGSLTRNCMMRVRRGGEVLWTGPVSSLKRFKDDVKEVTKGTECGVVLQGFSAFQEGDILEGYEVVYHEQEL